MFLITRYRVVLCGLLEKNGAENEAGRVKKFIKELYYC